MQNFRYCSPTEIIFGRETQKAVGTETKKYAKKVLLHYGGGHIKRSGLYDEVTASLKDAGVDYIELGGVQPNPRVGLVRDGIDLVRRNGVDFILAVGGGSVIDSSKGIAMGAMYDGDVWDFYSGKAAPEAMLPVGAVLTIPAAGSEASKSSVLIGDNSDKRPANFEMERPRFAVMNPELTYSLPPYQTASGAADIMAHAIERYFTNEPDVAFTDRLCEAGLLTIIGNAPKALASPDDYNARAQIMWASTVIHNDLMSTGRIGDWASHKIEHELSAINDVAHGAGLAVILPAWMQYVYQHDISRFVQYAVRVWNVEQDFFNPEKTALEGIARTKAFFKMMGLPTSLGEIGIGAQHFDRIADNCEREKDGTAGNFVRLDADDIRAILHIAK